MKSDKNFANISEQIGKVETSNLDMRAELQSKFEQKFQYVEERLKILKQDLVGYTDGRFEKLKYGPEQQRFMEELTEKWPLL